MNKKISHALAVLLTMLILVNLPNALFSENEDVSPDPWITSPSNSGLLYELNWERIVVSEENPYIKAVDLNQDEDIVSAVFEYSVDQETWNHIYTDTTSQFEGVLLPGSEGNRKIGEEGWGTLWNITGFAEGTYYLRCTMTDEGGKNESIIRELYYDPVPPVPEIYEPLYGSVVRGIVEFKARSEATDIAYIKLELLRGSDHVEVASGGSGYIQAALGISEDDKPPSSKGWYRQEWTGVVYAEEVKDGKGTCVPAAAANALAHQGHYDARIYPPGQWGNDEALAEALYDALGTDQTGTNAATPSLFKPPPSREVQWRTDGIGDGLKAYLESQGIGCSNKLTGYKVTVYKTELGVGATGNWYPIESEIDFKDYNNEIRKNQSVILWIMNWDHGADGKPGTEDDSLGTRNSHAVTGHGACTTANRNGTHSIEHVDPANTVCMLSETTWGSTGGFSTIGYPNTTNRYFVAGMWAVSPKWGECVVLDWDSSSEDGWITTWDTTTVEDGFYTLNIQMVDEHDHIGTDTIVVEVDNVPEYPDVTEDIYGEGGHPMTGPGWHDITEVDVVCTDDAIRFDFSVNGEFPSIDTFRDGAIMVLIDVDGEGVIPSGGIIDFYELNLDYGIFIPSPEFGEPDIFIEDLHNRTRDIAGAMFSIEGDEIVIEVDPEHIGNPDTIDFVAAIKTGITEIPIEDRVPNEGLAHVWQRKIKCDLNGDGVVNIIDIAIVAQAFGTNPDDLNWIALADQDKNDTVNIIDMATIAMDYGKTV